MSYPRSKSLKELPEKEPSKIQERISKVLAVTDLMVITVNTRIPYYYDIPLILGYPNSFHQRFRFKDKWLIDALKKATFPQGMKGVIVLRDMLKDFHCPIRYFEIDSHSLVDNIHFFDVKLLDIVDFGIPTGREAVLQDFISRLQHTFPPKSNGLDQHPFIYFIDWHNEILNKKSEKSSIEGNWGFIVNKLIDKSQYQGVPFLKVIEGSKKEFEKALYITDTIDEAKGNFTLKQGKTYYMDVLQKIEYSKENKKKLDGLNDKNLNEVSISEKEDLSFSIPYKIDLSSTTSCISIPSSTKIAVGEYDILRYFLKISVQNRSEDGVLELKSVQGEDDQYAQPHLLPVLLKTSRSARTSQTIIFILMVLFAGLDDILSFLSIKVNTDTKLFDAIETTGVLGIVFLMGLLLLQVDIFGSLKWKK
jgi:hypothetical protein